ncbi:MAG: SDR family oxidoreductase [Saccharospirillaceae bacterium]|nr:SDR family oxidoreductase [Saccharospirillaceae bacterium]
MIQRLLITGASGFLGSALSEQLIKNSIPFVAVYRSDYVTPSIKNKYIINTLDADTQWQNGLIGISCVIHCAARAHIMNEVSIDPLLEYRKVNTAGTLNLARQAAQAGVKRFIFISSIKVNGESTTDHPAFTADDKRQPLDPYGMSKSEAEQQLLVLANKTGMDVVIIRPPLVYGPGVKANFASLLNLTSKGLPLPFACINANKRSMVSVYNLVDLIITCIDHPKAANQVFLVSDDDDLSTADMVKKLANACDKSGWMLPIPLTLFQLVGKVLGKSDVINRLTGSLHVDITKTKTLLNWTPVMSVDEGFNKTADAFLQNKTFYNRRK